MSVAISRRTELDADLDVTAWYSGDPDLIDVAGLALNLACRLYPWPGDDVAGGDGVRDEFQTIDPHHRERAEATSRFTTMTDRLFVRALTEGWTRRRLLAALTKIDSDYRARYAVSSALDFGCARFRPVSTTADF